MIAKFRGTFSKDLLNFLTQKPENPFIQKMTNVGKHDKRFQRGFTTAQEKKVDISAIKDKLKALYVVGSLGFFVHMQQVIFMNEEDHYEEESDVSQNMSPGVVLGKLRSVTPQVPYG